MKFILTKKDVIALNEQFDNGVLRTEASLEFALSYAKKTENWTKALAWLVRAILLDHVFEEGSKRTAALLDIFACICQGMLPYAPQLLLASSIAGITSVSIIPHLHYQFFIFIVAVTSILRSDSKFK